MLTPDQIRARTKTVTRRTGWEFLKPGDLIRAVEKCQGLKKGEHIKPLAVLQVEAVRREPLDRMLTDATYGCDEIVREGFGWSSPNGFVVMFCLSHKVPNGVVGLRDRGKLGTLRYRPCQPFDEVTRIQFRYVD